jgi:hypothetical protein
MSDKPKQNVLTEWVLFDGRISGKAKFDQLPAHVSRGNYLTTSKVVRIYRKNGERIAETLHSLYGLEEGE